MLQIEIGIDPNIAQIGPFVLAWHGVASLIAIIIGLIMVHREFRRRGMSFDHWDYLVFWTLVGGIVGARLFFVIDHLGYFTRHPLEIFAVQEGGIAIYGAVFGGFVAAAIVTRFYRSSFRQLVDAVVPGLLIAQAVGRIGCALNGDAWGGPTSSPFSFVYTNPDALLPRDLLGVPTYPYPVYDIAVNLTVFAVVWPLRKRALPSGALFAIMSALYAVGRFAISFTRQENVWFLGLQEAQVVALVVLAVSCVALVWLFRREQTRPAQAMSTS
jgi:phosphatidylglycerol:prolipoprotein diacylglycerol transferase